VSGDLRPSILLVQRPAVTALQHVHTLEALFGNVTNAPAVAWLVPSRLGGYVAPLGLDPEAPVCCTESLRRFEHRLADGLAGVLIASVAVAPSSEGKAPSTGSWTVRLRSPA
jgi:hypothetical protein